MRAPGRRGTAVDDPRVKSWTDRFRFYRAPPTEADIHTWLGRFAPDHQDLAARILDAVEVINDAQIMDGYRACLAEIPGWNSDDAQRNGQWYFVGYGNQSDSGPAMLRLFREANRLNAAKYNGMFRSVVELPILQLTAADTVVFVDDFSGSGDQVVEHWPATMELIASEAKSYLVLTAATAIALEKISNKTDLQVLATHRLDPSDNVFNTACPYFTAKEREALIAFGKKADKSKPKGYGECGLLFVLHHKTPNNSLPILHAHNRKWKGLFPRYLEPA